MDPNFTVKKWAVIGLGAIGVLVANMAVDFGMKVYGFDPFISIDNAWGLSRKVKRAISKEEIFKNCDYISLHIPYMDETKDYVNADLLKETKEGLRLLNFAREADWLTTMPWKVPLKKALLQPTLPIFQMNDY